MLIDKNEISAAPDSLVQGPSSSAHSVRGVMRVEAGSWPRALDQTGYFVQTVSRDLLHPEAASVSLFSLSIINGTDHALFCVLSDHPLHKHSLLFLTFLIPGNTRSPVTWDAFTDMFFK